MEEPRPHTLSGLAVMLAMLLPVFSIREMQETSPEQDLRNGLLACAMVFLFYCALQLQDGELTRPHVVLWRIVHGITVLYLLFIVLLLSQNTSTSVDTIIRLVFNQPKDVGAAPLPRDETNEYSLDCNVTIENVQQKILDRYFYAHLIGWIVKALILRDWQMMWACSVMFEVFEVSLQRLMPNFSECWWDRWLLDVFGCNMLGMLIGMKLASIWGAKEYDWQGTRRWQLLRKLTRPQTFPSRFDWHVFASWRYFGIAMLVLFVVMLGELNGFFIKSSLRLGNQTWLVCWRIIFIVPAIYASVVELYAYAERRTNRIGRTAWLVISLGVLEFILAMKNFSMRKAFSPAQLSYSANADVCMAWFASTVFGVAILVLKLTRMCTSKQVRIVGIMAALPFAWLLWRDAWEYGGMKRSI